MQKINTTSLIIPGLLGSVIGASWHLGIAGMEVLSFFLPLLWSVSRKRMAATAVWLGYFLALSTDVMPNYLTIHPDAPIWIPVAIWLCGATILSLPWALLWKEDAKPLESVARAAAGLLLLTLPPLGVIAWCNPLLIAGAIFPGAGHIGLAITFAALAFSAAWRGGVGATTQMVLAIVMSTAVVAGKLDKRHAPVTSEWVGVTTTLGKTPEPADNEGWSRQHNASVKIALDALKGDARVVVMPEMIAGQWDRRSETAWLKAGAYAKEHDKAIVFGAILPKSLTQYLNGVVTLDSRGETLASARIPMPFGLWLPWTNWSASADWLGSGLIEANGQKAILSVCFEDFMVYPVALSMMATGKDKPAVVVSMANNWFATGRSSTYIQHRSISLMAQLYGLPLARSISY